MGKNKKKKGAKVRIEDQVLQEMAADYNATVAQEMPPQLVGQPLRPGHKGSGFYRFIKGPTESTAFSELDHATANTHGRQNRGMGQTVVEPIDYLAHVSRVPPCKFTEKQRRDYRNWAPALARQVAKRREQLQEKLRQQRIRQHQQEREVVLRLNLEPAGSERRKAALRRLTGGD